MEVNRPFSFKTAPNQKVERIMQGVATWCSFYRANPAAFAKEYLNITLYPFQQILLLMMNISSRFMYLASRGQGKSFLVAVFCVIRCILYPGTRVVVASKSFRQGKGVIEKITTILMPNSANLRLEIDKSSVNATEAYISFKNGSYITAVTANENSRYNRANILVIDEFRMVDKDIIDLVLRRFNASVRTPGYIYKEEYKHLGEENKEIYMSSCWYKSHWSWDKVKAYFKSMLNPAAKMDYFLCGLPYQLSVKEGIILKSAVEKDMSESDFSEINWSMEMECLWYGEAENAFFAFEDISKTRKIATAMYPRFMYDYINDKNFKRPEKKKGEIRVLAADIAVMGGKKNDATSIVILQLLPVNGNQYYRNEVYMQNIEGGHTETQAIAIRRLYEDFDCDYLVLDTNGVGIGIYDNLAKDLMDQETGIIYPALSCANDEAMAARCQVRNAPKVIYSIKASAAFNSEAAISLRDCMRRGKMRLLVTEADMEEEMSSIKQYNALGAAEKALFKLPHVQTTMLVNEMVNLDYEEKNNAVRVSEKGMERKDRYSAISYGNYVANILERKLRAPEKKKNYSSLFSVRAPNMGKGGRFGR